MRSLALLALVLLAPLSLPAAAAEPQCLQVYPWSELCEGDVQGFLDALGICRGPVCIEPALCLDRDCLAIDDILEPACPGGPPCPPDPSGGGA